VQIGRLAKTLGVLELIIN